MLQFCGYYVANIATSLAFSQVSLATTPKIWISRNSIFSLYNEGIRSLYILVYNLHFLWMLHYFGKNVANLATFSILFWQWEYFLSNSYGQKRKTTKNMANAGTRQDCSCVWYSENRACRTDDHISRLSRTRRYSPSRKNRQMKL